MNITEGELTRQLADVVAQYGTPMLRPEEWTVQMLAESQGIPYNRAALIVDRALNAKAVEFLGLRQLPNGHVSKAYRFLPR